MCAPVLLFNAELWQFERNVQRMQAFVKGPKRTNAPSVSSSLSSSHIPPALITWLGWKHENFNDYPLVAPFLTGLARWRGADVDYRAGRTQFRTVLFAFVRRFLRDCEAEQARASPVDDVSGEVGIDARHLRRDEYARPIRSSERRIDDPLHVHADVRLLGRRRIEAEVRSKKVTELARLGESLPEGNRHRRRPVVETGKQSKKIVLRRHWTLQLSRCQRVAVVG